MMSCRYMVWPGLLGALALASPGLQGAPPPGKAAPDEVAALAARIDQLIDARLKEENVPSAPVADDSEFLRRAYLDLIGRIPRVNEVHRFLADKSPDKRRKLIDELLRDPNH